MNMIASLRGTVLSVGLNSAVIECGGVGYAILATPQTLAEMHKGQERHIFTQMVVREDATVLYGFADTASRDIFNTLQSVSGLGPKLALAALSVYTPEDLATRISTSDVKGLQKIPGVGKRMAERMVVDLKDKVNLYAAAPSATNDTVSSAASPATSLVTESVVEALTGLGFTAAQADKAVATVIANQPDASTSEALRAALKVLGK